MVFALAEEYILHAVLIFIFLAYNAFIKKNAKRYVKVHDYLGRPRIVWLRQRKFTNAIQFYLFNLSINARISRASHTIQTNAKLCYTSAHCTEHTVTVYNTKPDTVLQLYY